MTGILANMGSDELKDLLVFVENEHFFRYDSDKDRAITYFRNLINKRLMEELMESIAESYIGECGDGTS